MIDLLEARMKCKTFSGDLPPNIPKFTHTGKYCKTGNLDPLVNG
jgi:hypothetical protein